jgi:hypothetical protein
LRICSVETAASAVATSGQPRAISGDFSTSTWRTIAPTTASPLVSSDRSAGIPFSPTSTAGSTSRSRIMISSDWPPAITFASSPCSARASSASGTLVGST